MKHNLKKIASFGLVLALSITISIPAFASEKETTSYSKNEVVLQRKTGYESIKSPYNISYGSSVAIFSGQLD